MTTEEKCKAIAEYCNTRKECVAYGGKADCPLWNGSPDVDCYEGITAEAVDRNYALIFPTPAIADSGDRTEFPSGAVRDMHTANGELKGRFDLLPMCVLMRLARHYENGSKKYGDRNWEKGIPCHSFADSAMRHLVKYLDGYRDEDHLIAAIWNLCGLAWTEEKKPELMDIPARKEENNA